MALLTVHENLCGLPALAWHFFETAHGKGACDGVGGIFKRLADEHSRRAFTPEQMQIITAEDLFHWGEKHVTGIKLFFLSEMEILDRSQDLEKFYGKFQTIRGTRKLHCFVPIDEGTVEVSRFSADTNTRTVKFVRRS